MRAYNTRELWLAFIAIVLISVAYLFVVSMLNGIPPASDFFGHAIGILGFLMMLMTESLYSLRKRSRNSRWGRMAAWLDFHIFTGLVGPYLVLLHSSWKFNGLAGIVMLLTVIIVVSGFIGRYLYTSVPRTADGIELEAGVLERQIAKTDVELKRWLEGKPELASALARRLDSLAGTTSGLRLFVFDRVVTEWSHRIHWWIERRRLPASARQQADQMERLVRRRRQLNRQIRTLGMARRLLALWHAVHIPIGMALFSAAFIHMGAAIYYATLLR